MNDCPNADVRDLLPDYLHERLDADARAVVAAHITACVDCSAELDLLRQLRAIRPAPKVDIAAIAAALPAYRAPARRTWVGWRAAAAITVMVAGASSIAVIQRGVPSSVAREQASISAPMPPIAPVTAPVSVAPAVPVPATSSTVAEAKPRSEAGAHDAKEDVDEQTPAASKPSRELAMGGGALGDLDDHELASLLKDIESLDAVPSVDVESTPTSPIAPSTARRP